MTRLELAPLELVLPQFLQESVLRREPVHGSAAGHADLRWQKQLQQSVRRELWRGP